MTICLNISMRMWSCSLSRVSGVPGVEWSALETGWLHIIARRRMLRLYRASRERIVGSSVSGEDAYYSTGGTGIYVCACTSSLCLVGSGTPLGYGGGQRNLDTMVPVY